MFISRSNVISGSRHLTALQPPPFDRGTFGRRTFDRATFDTQSILPRTVDRQKGKGAYLMGIQSLSYGTSLAIWDHRVLPVTRHK